MDGADYPNSFSADGATLVYQRQALANGSISRAGGEFLMVRPMPASHHLTFVRDWLPNVGG